MPVAEGDPTALLRAWSAGDPSALERLIPLLHEDLKRLARRYMAAERAGHTLQTTALVNEAFLRLARLDRIEWQNRGHFLAVSASLMRRVLTDFARSRRFLKRGGQLQRVPLEDSVLGGLEPADGLAALDDALKALSAIEPRKSQVVELRFFGGLSVPETATALGVSEETVMRDWRFAKAWLLQNLRVP